MVQVRLFRRVKGGLGGVGFWGEGIANPKPRQRRPRVVGHRARVPRQASSALTYTPGRGLGAFISA